MDTALATALQGEITGLTGDFTSNLTTALPVVLAASVGLYVVVRLFRIAKGMI